MRHGSAIISCRLPRFVHEPDGSTFLPSPIQHQSPTALQCTRAMSEFAVTRCSRKREYVRHTHSSLYLGGALCVGEFRQRLTRDNTSPEWTDADELICRYLRDPSASSRASWRRSDIKAPLLIRPCFPLTVRRAVTLGSARVAHRL